MTIVFFAAIGTHFSAIALPAEKKAIFTFEKSKSLKPTTEYVLFLKFIFFATLFSDAIRYSSLNLKFSFSITAKIFRIYFLVI